MLCYFIWVCLCFLGYAVSELTEHFLASPFTTYVVLVKWLDLSESIIFICKIGVKGTWYPCVFLQKEKIGSSQQILLFFINDRLFSFFSKDFNLLRWLGQGQEL